MEANAFIADQLKAEASARTGYGASALLAAARIIRTFPTQITNADQLKGIRGVGDGTRRRVKEILAQGARYQVPAPPPGEEKPNRKLANQSAASSSSAKPAGYDFTAIKFIGEVFSRKIHEQGIHTLEELEKGVENGTITLQPNQLAGLKYRVDLAERIPRDEVKEIGDLVLEEVRRQGMRGQITGSYRRGKESSGDVDVLITGEKNQIHRVVEALEKNLIEYTFSLGEVKLMAVAIGPTSGVYRSLDIRYVPEAIYIPSLLFSTGPFELNVHQRRLAIDRGLKLSEYGLIDKAGNTLDVRSEEEIFEALGMKYMSPEERETYNEG